MFGNAVFRPARQIFHFTYEAPKRTIISLKILVTGPQHAQSFQSATCIVERLAGFNFDRCQMDVELLMLSCLLFHPADRVKHAHSLLVRHMPQQGSYGVVQGMDHEVRTTHNSKRG